MDESRIIGVIKETTFLACLIAYLALAFWLIMDLDTRVDRIEADTPTQEHREVR